MTPLSRYYITASGWVGGSGTVADPYHRPAVLGVRVPLGTEIELWNGPVDPSSAPLDTIVGAGPLECYPGKLLFPLGLYVNFVVGSGDVYIFCG